MEKSLKEKGNECFSKQDFIGAVSFYTKAIDTCPTDHTLYSNRSISFSKQEKYKDALLDAEACIKLKANFARGYLRKCTALNGLGRYEEVLVLAQEGYKLKGSDVISQGCIAEWVLAIESIFKQKILDMQEEIGPFVPAECLVISDDYLTVLLNLVVARFNYSTTGVPKEMMIAYLFKIFQELDRMLQLFGHKPPSIGDEWINAVFNASKLDPTTSRVPSSEVAMLLGKSKELAMWLHNEVDHILYPLICPIICLAVIAITVRCISLNCISIDHHVVEVTTSACLVFFEKSLLSSPKYVGQHIGLYKELLEGIALSSHVFSEKEILSYKAYIVKLECLLKLNPECDREYFDKAMVSIGLIKLRLNEDPGFDHVSHGSGHGKAISRRPFEEILSFVNFKEEAVKDMLQIPLKEPLPFTALEDSQDLICCTSGLIKHGDISRAIEVFKLSEEAFTRILQRQIINKAFSLDTGPEVILAIQTMIYIYANSFLKANPILVSDTIIRWKCIFTEFRALLMQLGMGEKYLKVFKMIQKMNLQKEPVELTLAEIAERHQNEVHSIMCVKGMLLLTSLLKQSHETVQNALKNDEILLEYCSWNSEYSYSDHNDGNEPDGLLLILKKNNAPVIRTIDFKKVVAVAQNWIKVGPKASEQETDKIMKALCNLLLPMDIQAELSDSSFSRVFVSLDPTFLLPIELFPLPCGEVLGKKCTLVHLSASREIIRSTALENTKRMFAIIEAHRATQAGEESSNTAASDDKLSERVDSTPTLKVDSPSTSTKNCVIFAAPNFDLELKSVDDNSGTVHRLTEAISALFLKPSKQTDIATLPKTKDEAHEIEYIVSTAENSLAVECILEDDATLSRVLQIEMPFVLHFSTHGFSKPNIIGVSGTFWDDTKCGLLLAGANTYCKGEMCKVVPEAGTGQLSALPVMGMNLSGTRLVYLSTCVSAQGSVRLGESINSLAQAFRAAGAKTVIATLWTVFDNEARMFAIHFYHEAVKTGVSPSQALKVAKERMKESGYHWIFWSSFICIGDDTPLFPD